MRRTLPGLARRVGCLAVVTFAAGCLLLPVSAMAQDAPAVVPAPEPPPAPTTDQDNRKDDAETKDVEILTRGPLHEAFAEQVAKDPKPGIVAAKKPPADVNEIPPEFKPEGENVIWIPGYWFWDEERKDYIWISGVWRSIPPNRRWVPGYWQATDKGHQWVSGLWAPAAARELPYRDPPPESLDRGPTSAAPTQEHFWIPGGWNYANGAYGWRAGYWHPYQEDWTWVAEHYTWTPQGCIFVSGYWDYSLARRGHCYAPVYFHDDLYARSDYRYRPNYLLNGAGLLLHLFVHPHHGHYYFGDYYGSHYAGLHYYSAHDYYDHHRGYDPLYTYYRAHYQHHGVDYHSRMRGWNAHFTKHADQRPPRTYAARRQHLDRQQGDARLGSRTDHLTLGRSLDEAVARPRSSERFRRVASGEATEANRAIRRSRDLSSQRRGSEGRRTTGGAAVTSRKTQVAERRRLSLPPASSPAIASGQTRRPRPADAPRSTARSGFDRRIDSSRSSRSFPSSTLPSRTSPTRSSAAAHEAIRRHREAETRRRTRPSSSNRSVLPRPSPSTARSSPSLDRTSAPRPGTSRAASGSSGRSVRPNRPSRRPSGSAHSVPPRGSRPSSRPTTSRPTTSRPTTSRPSASRPTTSRPATSRPTTSRPRASRPSASTPSRSPSRASRSSSRPSSRPSRAARSTRRSTPSASRPSRSSSTGRARSSGSTRRASPSRSSSRGKNGKKK